MFTFTPFYGILVMYIYFDEGKPMKIIKLSLNDTVELKKPHPCGAFNFRVARVGTDIRIICLGCSRDMNIDRIKLEKAVKKIVKETPSS